MQQVTLPRGAALLKEGERPGAVYIISEGVLGRQKKVKEAPVEMAAGGDKPIARRYGAAAGRGLRSVQEGSDALIHQPKFKETLPKHARTLPHGYLPPEQLAEESARRLERAEGTLVGMAMPTPSVSTLELSVVGPGQLVGDEAALMKRPQPVTVCLPDTSGGLPHPRGRTPQTPSARGCGAHAHGVQGAVGV